MRLVSADDLTRVLDYPDLVEAIREMFREGCESPVRHQHSITMPDGPEATLLLMPAWRAGRHIGVKLVTVFPSNGEKGLPAVMANYYIADGNTGMPLAMLDGDELTARRTASASALAATYLAREDARTMLMVGTGSMAPHLVHAHACVRPITDVLVWGRNPDKAKALARRLDESRLNARHAPDLEAAARQADVVSCATLATEPLVRGAWLHPGQHLDLVGAFKASMRETDDEAVKRARVYVDTRGGALKEGGDIVQAIASGAIGEDHVLGDLFDLTRGTVRGRGGAEEITLFKSCGASLEDLAAAELALARLQEGEGE